ncbi:MAG TPA: hypothetical protein VFW47_05725 [Phenylobacterium sp.]|nr:hypothetical protein [Phenylobacterium sp.]
MAATLLPDLTPAQRRRAGREVLKFHHRLDETGLFSDAALARLIDETGRDRLVIRTVGTSAAEPWIAGEAGDQNGAALVAAARKGRLCIVAPVAGNIRYCRVFARLMDEFAHAMGLKVLDAEAQVVIASPRMGAAFHVDSAETMVLHVRGGETVQVCPPRGPGLGERRLEAIVREEAPADLPADRRLAADATPVVLQPGEAAWWPLHSPHRTVNGEGLNVSVTVTFASPSSRRANGVVYTNGFLRRRFGLRPVSSRTPGLLQPAYLAAARLLQSLRPQVVAAARPAPRFEVDLDAPGCIRWRKGERPRPRRAA